MVVTLAAPAVMAPWTAACKGSGFTLAPATAPGLGVDIDPAYQGSLHPVSIEHMHEMNTIDISVTSEPAAADLEIIGTSLSAFNEADVGPADRKPLAVLVRSANGALIAGISGYTAWGWLYVQWLWVAESERGQQLAGRMLEAAEAEARTRACHAAYIDTFNPIALRTYQRAGYAPFGELKDFPKGRTRTFLSKSL